MSGERQALDAALDRAGTDVVLRRINGGNIDVTVRAVVRGGSPDDLVNGQAQARRTVIISPTQILAAGWPGAEASNPTVADKTLPRRNDKIITAGRTHNVEAVAPFYIAGELVRLELEILG